MLQIRRAIQFEKILRGLNKRENRKVTEMDVVVLLILSENGGGMIQAEMRRAMKEKVDNGSSTYILYNSVSRLQQQGLVEATPVKVISRYSITTAGRAYLHLIENLLNKIV